MNAGTAPYAPAFEVLNAIIIGIVLFLITCLLFWLVYNLLKCPETFRLQDPDNLMQTLFSAFIVIGTVLFLGLFWGACSFILSLLQFLLFALPIVSFISRGLEEDAARSWAFFITCGVLIGGRPWWLLGLLIFDSTVDLGSPLLVTAPGPIIGLYAGASLKYLLAKRVRTKSIENSIK